jgi:hypothetical protein
VSMFRKTVLATAIVGAGLGSMSGAAFAGDAPDNSGQSDHHHSSHHHASGTHESSSCTNNVEAKNATGAGSLANVLGGAQTIIPVNLCHIVSDNQVLNDNEISVL